MKRLYHYLFGTLRGRLILGVAAVHAVMMALFIGDLTVRQRAMLLDRQVEEATALSQTLATSAAGWIIADDISGLQELVEAQHRYPEILFAILADEEGRVLAHTNRSRQGLFMLDLPREARQTVLSRSPALVDVAVPAMIGEHHVGWARVGVGQKAAGRKLAEITRSGVAYTLAAILIGSVIAWFMGRQITRRLYAVQETMDAVRSGNRQARSPVTGTDEPAVMAREFNAMLDRLAELDAELRTSEGKYRSFIRKVQTAIVVHDGQGRILDSNPMAQDLLGLSANQLLGKVLIDPEWHFLGEDGSVLPVAGYPVSLVLSGQQPLRDYVTGILRPDRETITWVLVNGEPEFTDTGEMALVIVSFVDITERKRADEALRRAMARLNEAQRIAHIGSWELDLERNVLTWSQEIYRMFEIDPKQFGATYEAFLNAIHPDDRMAVDAAYTNSLKTRKPYVIDHRLLFPDGRVKYVNEQCETVYDESGRALRSIGTVQDITERRRAEEVLHRLNRELRAITDCNKTLIRAEDEQTLLGDICRIICDTAGYRMVWVGYAENDDARTIRPVAWAGVEGGYLSKANITWADTEQGRGPTGMAIRSGESACIQDFIMDAHAAPWRESALQHGYRSSIALPLKDEGARTFGALNIYSTEPHAFTPDEIRLLEELSGDLAFGITVLRSRVERKRAEQTLRESEEKFSVAFHASPNLLAITRMDGTILDVNEGYSRLLGYSRDESIKKTTAELDIWGDPADRGTFITRLKESGQITDFETKLRRKDGILITVIDSARTINLQGEPCILSIVHDITERKGMEEELRRINERFSLASRAARLGVWDWDIQKNELVWDDGMYTLYGIKREDFAGAYEAWLNGVHPHDRRPSDEISKLARSGKREYDTEFRVVWPDGSIHHLKAYGKIVRDADGRPLRMTGINFDITGLKRTEEDIRKLNQELEKRVADRTAQLEAANKELEAFAYSVSHDLRAPLRGIDGFSQILLEEYQDRVDDQGKHYLQRVRLAAQRMAQLIDDLLALSRVSRSDMTVQEVNLSRMAQEIADDLHKTDPERQVEFVIHEGIKAQGDDQLLRVVLENIIENAWKFTSKHPTARIVFGLNQQEETPVYFVRDDGAGFDMKYGQKLFGAFQRLHTATEFPGTGIGLATVQRIIHRHGGRVWAEGEVEKGAMFYFTLT